jgi:hypothetical protein
MWTTGCRETNVASDLPVQPVKNLYGGFEKAGGTSSCLSVAWFIL